MTPVQPVPTTQSFRIAPSRQEINWRCQWKAVAWAYIFLGATMVAFAIATGNLPVEATAGRVVAGVVGFVLAIIGIAAASIPLLELASKALAARQSAARRISLVTEDDLLRFYAAGERYLSVPRDVVAQVQLHKANGDVIGLYCGLGLLLNDIERVDADQDIVEAMKRSYQERGCHVWLASLSLGNRNQIKSLSEWFKRVGFADQHRDITVPDEQCVPWDRSCWMLVGITTIGVAIVAWSAAVGGWR